MKPEMNLSMRDRAHALLWVVGGLVFLGFWALSLPTSTNADAFEDGLAGMETRPTGLPTSTNADAFEDGLAGMETRPTGQPASTVADMLEEGAAAMGIRPMDLPGSGYTGIQATEAISVYLPLIFKSDPCMPIPEESYGAISVLPPVTDRPAEIHADLNLSMRSYRSTTGYLGLIDLTGGTDPSAPQLPGLFEDNRTPTFTHLYQVYDWDWGCNCRGDPITNPAVTLAGFEVTPGEIVCVPGRGVTIGDGYEALVLYASTERITLKYTREDNVVNGYTLHIENVCVEPSLLALYQYWNENGRGYLPALRAGQGLGRARDSEVRAAIRDNGSFMETRSRKDWWQGR